MDAAVAVTVSTLVDAQVVRPITDADLTVLTPNDTTFSLTSRVDVTVKVGTDNNASIYAQLRG